MSTKKRVLINIGLTLCLFGLVTLKVIRWHTHSIDVSWIFKHFVINPGINLFLLVVTAGYICRRFLHL